IFDDFKTQIPNDSLDYKIEWKTNGAFGSFESEVKEAAILDLDGIIYTSTNTATSTGEEKFMATLYSRPKGSSDEFTLNGSAQTNLTISNDPKKKYYIIEDTFYLKKFIDEPCGDNPNSVRNLLINSFFVPKIPGAKSYSLSTNEIVLASRVLDDGSTVFTRYGILNWNWNNNSTQYPNSSAEGTTADGTLINNTAEFELPFIPGALNLCHPDYAEIVAIRGALNGIGYLTVTLE
ncbi:hypothetical protein, partial [Maribacter hydrothermalis]